MMILLSVRRQAIVGWGKRKGNAYSSRTQLPTDTPPQLMPDTMLPAKLSLRGLSRLVLLIDIG